MEWALSQPTMTTASTMRRSDSAGPGAVTRHVAQCGAARVPLYDVYSRTAYLIGMVLYRKLTIRALDSTFIGVFSDFKDVIIISTGLRTACDDYARYREQQVKAHDNTDDMR